MKASEVREKYIKFFKSSPRNHKQISPASLVLEDDPTTLFTSSGMQPLVPYLMGKFHPKGKRLVNSQPSLRLQDIDEVGDIRHTTFFEMLGNWSLGDYFKKEQLAWFYEFLTKELGLEPKRLWVSVFEGNKQIPKDEESAGIWKSLGIPEKRIYFYSVEKNWWSRFGTPDQMPIGEIGGPDSEVFYDFGEDLKLHENSVFRDQVCHPNCDCGRFSEIGNSVFIQYKKVKEGVLEELPQRNVDFGGGLERITACVNDNPDIFRIDLFSGIISEIEKRFNLPESYGQNPEKDRSIRIIADHMRASSVLISSGILPSNKAHGYVLRKLIRRAVFHSYLLSKDFTKAKALPYLDDQSKFDYPFEFKRGSEISSVINKEADKFADTLELGIKKLKKAIENNVQVSGSFVFDLYQTNGIPFELTVEILEKYGKRLSNKQKEEFEKEFEKHKELSRTTSAGIFKGGLADYSHQVVKLHTATHLLLASLRKVLGNHIVQKGQNITRERSRFDFLHTSKLTAKEILKIENMINEIIEKDLPVNFKIMSKSEAEKTGAVHAFNEKYSDTVKVYYVGNSLEEAFSKEFCGGPHVSHTKEIGHVRIKKQEKIGIDIIRLYLVLEN